MEAVDLLEGFGAVARSGAACELYPCVKIGLKDLRTLSSFFFSLSFFGGWELTPNTVTDTTKFPQKRGIQIPVSYQVLKPRDSGRRIIMICSLATLMSSWH